MASKPSKYQAHYESWFPHDADATSDPKIQSLIDEFGWESVAWFWDILGRLRKAPDHRIEFDRPYVRVAMARHYGIPVAKLEQIVERMFNDLDLLVCENGKIGSKGMDRHMEKMHEKKKQQAYAGAKSGESRRGEAKEANRRSTDVERDDERGLEERREEKRREDTLPPTPFSQNSNPNQKKTTLDFLLETWQSVRDKQTGKIDNVNDFEKKQLNALYWRLGGDTGAEQILKAIEYLGGIRKFATIDQIKRVVKGELLDDPKTGPPQNKNANGSYALHKKDPKAKPVKSSAIVNHTEPE